MSKTYGSWTDFVKLYGPHSQSLLASLSEDKAFFGKAPTLATVRKEYQCRADLVWLDGQLGNLSEFCGVREKITKGQLDELAVIIASEYYYFKISELMLFFIRFKAGRYGQMYGVVDPLRITTALLEFKQERNEAYARHEEEERKRKLIDWSDAMPLDELMKMRQARRWKQTLALHRLMRILGIRGPVGERAKAALRKMIRLPIYKTDQQTVEQNGKSNEDDAQGVSENEAR